MEPVKPRLRGWLHAGTVPASLIAGIAGIALIRLARRRRPGPAPSTRSLPGCCSGQAPSTTAVPGGHRGRLSLRRLDHAGIFLTIAGTCTPQAALLLPPNGRSVLLWTVWAGALAGIAFPTLIVVGGLLHSAGAVVCALQRPDLSPRWFGFHEVFHALTVAAFTVHCIAVLLAAYWPGAALEGRSAVLPTTMLLPACSRAVVSPGEVGADVCHRMPGEPPRWRGRGG
ncbi:hemolysin III family protein [Streptomyces sp. NPDC048142]|uniref:hemolysin III family protein n=1 Tax=Streptomyces sp. NPDC048142 TaxID=3365501 RepID=UPI003723FB92